VIPGALYDALDQATAEMLAAAAVMAKMLMQTEPADELSDELSDELRDACKQLESSVANVRKLRGANA
jgi:hypothetical protein